MENLIKAREYILLHLRDMLRDDAIDYSSIKELLKISEELEKYMFPITQKTNSNFTNVIYHEYKK